MSIVFVKSVWKNRRTTNWFFKILKLFLQPFVDIDLIGFKPWTQWKRGNCKIRYFEASNFQTQKTPLLERAPYFLCFVSDPVRISWAACQRPLEILSHWPNPRTLGICRGFSWPGLDYCMIHTPARGLLKASRSACAALGYFICPLGRTSSPRSQIK